MQETQLKVIEKIIRLSAAFPHSKLTEDTFDVYAEALQDVPEHILDTALIQAAQDSEFFPTLHRIREVITDMMFGLVPTAEEAWEQVTQWLNGKREKLSDPLITRVVEMMGGWWSLSRSENIGVDRGQFLKMYANLRERERNHLLTSKTVLEIQEWTIRGRIAGHTARQIPAPKQVRPLEDEPDQYTPMSTEEGIALMKEILGKQEIGKKL